MAQPVQPLELEKYAIYVVAMSPKSRLELNYSYFVPTSDDGKEGTWIYGPQSEMQHTIREHTRLELHRSRVRTVPTILAVAKVGTLGRAALCRFVELFSTNTPSDVCKTLDYKLASLRGTSEDSTPWLLGATTALLREEIIAISIRPEVVVRALSMASRMRFQYEVLEAPEVIDMTANIH